MLFTYLNDILLHQGMEKHVIVIEKSQLLTINKLKSFEFDYINLDDDECKLDLSHLKSLSMIVF